MTDEKKEKTFQTGRPSKKEELMKVVQEAQAPLVKALNKNREVMTGQQARLKVLEDNQTQVVKVLEEMRANPGNVQEGASGGMNTGQMLQSMILRSVMGEGSNPTKVALDLAREFNKTYMTGQKTMLTMMSLLSKKKSLDALFGEEEEA